MNSDLGSVNGPNGFELPDRGNYDGHLSSERTRLVTRKGITYYHSRTLGLSDQIPRRAADQALLSCFPIGTFALNIGGTTQAHAGICSMHRSKGFVKV